MTVTAKPKDTSAHRIRPGARGTSAEGRPSAADLAARNEAAERERADRVSAVVDVISATELPLAIAAAAEQKRIGADEIGSFTLDIVTLESHKAPLAEAITDLADSFPVLGMVLDRLAKATPFAALFGVVVSLGAQIAENHRALPSHLRGLSPNLVAREDFAEHLRAEAEATAAEAEFRNGHRKVRDNPQA